MSDRPTPETDAAASPHIGFYSCATVTANFARQLERERDDARSVADELSAIAARYLGWHLSRTPMGPDDDHLAQASRITETLARWKALASA